jgi:hypothetical protein
MPSCQGYSTRFDLFHSIRFETLIDGIEAFAAWVRSTNGRRIAETGHGHESVDEALSAARHEGGQTEEPCEG